uniref:M23 family metallopeptidase n=1 Tax=candidate division WOR-3 bacterium TaxID=2052148 RepID=A0A7C4XUF0_UNCW3
MNYLGKLIIIILILHIDGICTEKKNSTDPAQDTTGLNSSRIISLEKKLTPTDRFIKFIAPILPGLSEPSIIHFNIPVLLPKMPGELEEKAIGEKIPKGVNIVSSQPRIADTLLNSLIQSISLDKNVYKQGEIATLNVTTTLPIANPQIKFLSQSYKLYPAGRNIYRTILAVPMNADTGRHYMKLKYTERDSTKTIKLPFRVIAGDFAEKDTVELDIHILTEETLEMLKYEGRYFSRAYSKNFDTLLCNGDFIWPCAGSITSLYGMARRYNKNLDKWSHKAIDIANAIGTKVCAANTGIVVMVEELEAHGKSIVIAHGQGIHTVYLHLNKIYVAKGDTVKKGQEIGELGKTGMCTGPNLHFQIMVNRIPTDPRCWIPGAKELKKGDFVRPEIAKE